MATAVMSTADVEAAIDSITEQKDELRKSFETLKSFSPSIVSVAFQWNDIEGHISSIEKSIKDRFREFKNLNSSLAEGNSNVDPPAVKVEKKQGGHEILPRPELMALCVNMDGKGLISFLTENKKDIVLIRRELSPALLSAPDPVTFVLDFLDSFVQSKTSIVAELLSISRPCLTVLECLKSLSLEITQEAWGRALKIAVEWKEMINNLKKESKIVVLCFFYIVVTFGLIESFEDDDILSLIVQLCWRKELGDLFRNSELEKKIPHIVEATVKVEAIENVHAKSLINQKAEIAGKSKMSCNLCGRLGHFAKDCRAAITNCFNCGQKGHYYNNCSLWKAILGADPPRALPNAISHDLVDKLIKNEKFLIAVRVVLSSNLVKKYPPSSLLDAYVNKSKRRADEMRQKGDKCVQSMNAAIGNEIAALKEVVKLVEVCKLESVYPCENHVKRIEKLEKESKENRSQKSQITTSHAAAAATAVSAATAATSDAASTDAATTAATPAAVTAVSVATAAVSATTATTATTVATTATTVATTATVAYKNTKKRPRTSTSGAPVFASHGLKQSNHAQFGPVDQPPYAVFDGSNNSLAAPYVSIPGNPCLPANFIGLGSLPGTAYYDGAAAMNGGYMAGLPAYNPPFNPSMYPWS